MPDDVGIEVFELHFPCTLDSVSCLLCRVNLRHRSRFGAHYQTDDAGTILVDKVAECVHDDQNYEH